MKIDTYNNFTAVNFVTAGYDAFLKTFSFDILSNLFSNLENVSIKNLCKLSYLFDSNDLTLSLYTNLIRNYTQYLNKFYLLNEFNIYNIQILPCTIGFIVGGIKSLYKTKPEPFFKGAIKTFAYEYSNDNIKVETPTDIYKLMVFIEMIGECIDYVFTGKFDLSGTLLGSAMITAIIQFPHEPLKKIGDEYIKQVFSEDIYLIAQNSEFHNSEFI